MNPYHLILIIYPLALLVMIFYGAKVTRGGEIASEYLNIEQTKMIQAAACIAIIIHHITQQITGFGAYDKGPVTIFNYVGYLFTALFFFVSGYGLYISFLNKNDYLKTFVKKRFPRVLIPFFCINALGVLLCAMCYGIRYTLSGALSDIFGLTLVNSNGWFIVEIVVLYVLFYSIFNLVKNKDLALFLMCVAVVLLIIYSSLQGHDTQGDKSHWFKGEWWYNSTVTFAFGLIYARFRQSIDEFINKHYRGMIVIFSILMAAVIFASKYVVLRYGYYHDHMYSIGRRDEVITLIVQSVSCIIWTLFVLMLNMKITLGNPVLKYLSGISVELFLIHGYFVNRIFKDLHMKDVFIYMIILISSIACTAVLSPLIRRLTDAAVKLLNKEKIYNDTLESEIARKKHEKNIKRIKIAIAAAVILAFVISVGMTFGRFVFAKAEYTNEIEAIANASAGDVVSWGHMEQDYNIPGEERINWIVIGREGDEVRLLCEKGMAGSYYHQKHMAVSWEECDLRALMNSQDTLKAFSKYEYAAMVPCDGDMISLLTVSEAEELFDNDKERKIGITAVAESQGTNTNRISKLHQWDMKGYGSSWWWLKGDKGETDITAPIVNVEGEVVTNEKYVNKPGGAIRPVIIVDTATAQ